MLGKPRILSLFFNSFNKFNKHQHSCKILYVWDNKGIMYGNKIDEWIDIDFVSGNTH